MTGEAPPPFDEELFFISPIGPDGSDARRRADLVLQHIVTPAAAKVGLVAVRADCIPKMGDMVEQIREHVRRARAVVADLTGGNPNVFYELALRHACGGAAILISEDAAILFDISHHRTIRFDHTDPASRRRCLNAIEGQLRTDLDTWRSPSLPRKRLGVEPLSGRALQQRLGQRVREERRHRGMTQEGLAKAAGLDRTHVGSIELGNRQINLGTVVLLAEALDVDTADLVGEAAGA